MKPMLRGAALPSAFVAMLFLGVWTVYGGGWAVVTVEDWPEYAVAGEAFTIEYSVRQHGLLLTPGADASIRAASDSGSVEFRATPTAKAGFYRADVLLPEAGEWTLTLRGWQESTLLPLRVVAAGNTPLPVSMSERGKQLFVAKGCNACHEHRATGREILYRAGPDLSSNRYSPDFLTALLRDPEGMIEFQTWRMPDLDLDSDEVQALVAFINHPEGTASRESVSRMEDGSPPYPNPR